MRWFSGSLQEIFRSASGGRSFKLGENLRRGTAVERIADAGREIKNSVFEFGVSLIQ
jgi:hypothetical protein